MPTLEIVEGATWGLKPEISIVRMDSLDSNFSFLMDAGLEKPIHTENQFLNLTPTQQYTGVVEDWAALNSSQWRDHFVFEWSLILSIPHVYATAIKYVDTLAELKIGLGQMHAVS